MPYNMLKLFLIFIIINTSADGFMNIMPLLGSKLPSINKGYVNNIKLSKVNKLNENCNDKVLYTNYRIGLRKLRKTVKNTNIDTLISIINFTNTFASNITWTVNNTEFNNEDIGVQKLIMSNIHIDVSNVKYIHISTKNDTIIVELDKKNKMNSIINEINNLDAIINTLNFLMKIININ
jgi:hypothetical protein